MKRLTHRLHRTGLRGVIATSSYDDALFIVYFEQHSYSLRTHFIAMHDYYYGSGNWGPSVGTWGGGHEWMLGLLAIAGPILLLAILWSIFWKGLALWHSARRAQPWW